MRQTFEIYVRDPYDNNAVVDVLTVEGTLEEVEAMVIAAERGGLRDYTFKLVAREGGEGEG